VEMRLTRLVKLSLLHYLRQFFVRSIKGEVATTKDYRCFSGASKPWLPSRDLLVYCNGSPLPSSTFSANYQGGYVTRATAGDASDVIQLYYSYNWLHIVSSWPSDDVMVLPVLAVQSGPRSELPLELGGPDRIQYLFHLELFTADEGARDDISDELRDVFSRRASLIDFNLGFGINADGTKNVDFDEARQCFGEMSFPKVSISPNPSGVGEPMEKGRAHIRLVVEPHPFDLSYR
jgi:hypothetical protein